MGVETIVEGRVISAHEGQVTVEANGCTLYAIGEVASSRPVYLCLRPEDITLWPADGFPPSSARNRFPARVQKVIPQGALTRVVVDCGFPMTALVTRTSALELNLAEGKDVTIAFKASAVHLIPR